MQNLNLPSMERTIALSEINAVLHRYAILARDKVDFRTMIPLFTSDALFVLPNGVPVSPAEINKVVQGDEANFIRHHVTTIDIFFTGEREARSTTQFFAMTDMSQVDHWGCWEDVLCCDENGMWRIKEKRIVLEGVDPKGWAAGKYQAVRGSGEDMEQDKSTAGSVKARLQMANENKAA